MDAYSLDLRKKIVKAKERGTPTVEVAKTFGVGVSTVKRYAATAREGRSLVPKKHPGSPSPSSTRVQEEGCLRQTSRSARRPTLPQRREFLRRTCGVSLSDSTVSRMLKRMGWTRKKDRWVRVRGMSS
jgi:transposase